MKNTYWILRTKSYRVRSTLCIGLKFRMFLHRFRNVIRCNLETAYVCLHIPGDICHNGEPGCSDVNVGCPWSLKYLQMCGYILSICADVCACVDKRTWSMVLCLVLYSCQEQEGLKRGIFSVNTFSSLSRRTCCGLSLAPSMHFKFDWAWRNLIYLQVFRQISAE